MRNKIKSDSEQKAKEKGKVENKKVETNWRQTRSNESQIRQCSSVLFVSLSVLIEGDRTSRKSVIKVGT